MVPNKPTKLYKYGLHLKTGILAIYEKCRALNPVVIVYIIRKSWAAVKFA